MILLMKSLAKKRKTGVKSAMKSRVLWLYERANKVLNDVMTKIIYKNYANFIKLVNWVDPTLQNVKRCKSNMNYQLQHQSIQVYMYA